MENLEEKITRLIKMKLSKKSKVKKSKTKKSKPKKTIPKTKVEKVKKTKDISGDKFDKEAIIKAIVSATRGSEPVKLMDTSVKTAPPLVSAQLSTPEFIKESEARLIRDALNKSNIKNEEIKKQFEAELAKYKEVNKKLTDEIIQQEKNLQQYQNQEQAEKQAKKQEEIQRQEKKQEYKRRRMAGGGIQPSETESQYETESISSSISSYIPSIGNLPTTLTAERLAEHTKKANEQDELSKRSNIDTQNQLTSSASGHLKSQQSEIVSKQKKAFGPPESGPEEFEIEEIGGPSQSQNKSKEDEEKFLQQFTELQEGAIEEEKARQAAEKEKARQAAEEEKARQAAEEEEARQAAEEEQARRIAEEKEQAILEIKNKLLARKEKISTYKDAKLIVKIKDEISKGKPYGMVEKTFEKIKDNYKSSYDRAKLIESLLNLEAYRLGGYTFNYLTK